MVEDPVVDVHVRAFENLVSPAALRAELPASDEVNTRIRAWRREVSQVISGEDARQLVVIVPARLRSVDGGQRSCEAARQNQHSPVLFDHPVDTESRLLRERRN